MESQQSNTAEISLAYRCGWIFAALEAAGVVHNVAVEYLKASQTPSIYFGPAIARLFPRETEVKQLVDEQFLDLIGHMPATGWPSQLTMQEQGEFAIGYWHHKGRIDVKIRLTPKLSLQLSSIEKRRLSTLISRKALTVKNAQGFLAQEHRMQQQQEEARSRVVTLSVDLVTLAHAEKLQVKISRLLTVAAYLVAQEQQVQSEAGAESQYPETDAERS